MRTKNPRLLLFPLVLMLGLAIFVACGATAAPTAAPSQPESSEVMTQDGEAMAGESMAQDGEAMADDSMAQAEEKTRVDGWYRDRAVEYYDFGGNSSIEGSVVNTAPIYVFVHGFNADGSPQFVEGQHNVVDVVPGEDDYSDLWQVMLVTVPGGYEPDSITSKAELDAAGYVVTATDMLVNCPGSIT